MKCMRCGRQTKNPRAGLGPVCARKTLGELTKRNERARERDARQVDWVNQESRPA